MPEKEFEASISVEWIDTDQEPFRPEKTTEIFAILEPLEAEQSTFVTPEWNTFYNDFVLPPSVSYERLPEYKDVERELIINIETTAVAPWEGRIVCIGILDPNALAPEAMNFIRETEEETLQEFLDFFEQSPYTTFVGYNVSFDYRFIYAACQKYRKEARAFMAADLYDLMQQQKQVKHEFVFGFNKPGKLEEWATYLLGAQPYAPQEQVYKWLEEGNIEEIVNFNSDKLAKAYGLWVLNKIVEGSIPGAEIVSRPGESSTGTEQQNPVAEQGPAAEQIPIQCPNCKQVQTMPKTAKVINCHVCGEPIAHP